MRSLMYLVLFSVLLSCKGGLETMKTPATLKDAPENVYLEQQMCYKIWNEIFSEWKENGGGFKKSMITTREFIANDSKSSFSKIVRKAWSIQESRRFYEGLKNFGYWDVSNEDYLEVTNIYFSVSGVEMPDSCKVMHWVSNVFWNDLINTTGTDSALFRFYEVPKNMEWHSPYAQQWMTYWIFVNLKED